MVRRISIVLAVLLIFAALGVPLIMATPAHHDFGCPFMLQETAICATGLEHSAHFKWAFLAVVGEILLLLFFVGLSFGSPGKFDFHNPQTVRYRLIGRIPERPTLFQELFSSGILNPKPY